MVHGTWPVPCTKRRTCRRSNHFHTVATSTYNAPVVASQGCKDLYPRLQRSGSLRSLTSAIALIAFSQVPVVALFGSPLSHLIAYKIAHLHTTCRGAPWHERMRVFRRLRCFYRDGGCHVVPCTFSLIWQYVRSSSSRSVYPLYFFVRDPRCVIRDPVRNPEPHAGFNERLGPRTGSVVRGGIKPRG